MRFRSIRSCSEPGQGPRVIRARTSRGVAPLVLPALMLLSARFGGALALAAEPVEEKTAREHYERGREAFRAGRYEDAYREFEAGYNLCQRPKFLLDMAHAERRRGELRNARDLYRRYLLVDPESKLSASVEAVLREIETVLATEKVEPEAGLDPAVSRTAAAA